MEISYKDLKNLITINKNIINANKRLISIYENENNRLAINKQKEIDILEPIIADLEKQLNNYNVNISINE